MNIVDYIPFGKDKAVTRRELGLLTGWRDRRVRKEIEDARCAGFIIINTQDGAGYYQTEDEEEIIRQIGRCRRRALSVLRQIKPMEAKLKEIRGKNQIQIKEDYTA